MDNRRWGQWILLAVVCLSFSIGESYAQKNDFANLRRYSKENAALPQATKKDKRVIFMGNSITEGWVRTHPDFFKSNGYIGRGISGQTSYQFLLRFREDVINLSPALVVINAGTNDVAENTQAYNEDYTFGNIVSMAELAKANKIPFVNYYKAMVVDENQALNPQYTKDGVHPTSEGYDIMETLIKNAIEKAL